MEDRSSDGGTPPNAPPNGVSASGEASDTQLLDFLERWAIVKRPGETVREAIRRAMREGHEPPVVAGVRVLGEGQQ